MLMLLLISDIVILALETHHCLCDRHLEVTVSLIFSSLLTVGDLEDRLDGLLAADRLVVGVARVLGSKVRWFAFAECLLRDLSASRVMKWRMLAEVCEMPRAIVLVLTFLHLILSINMVLQILLVLVIRSKAIDAYLHGLDAFEEFI